MRCGRHSASFASSKLTVRKYSADRKSTRLNSSHQIISYAVFCLKKKKKESFNRVTGQSVLSSDAGNAFMYSAADGRESIDQTICVSSNVVVCRANTHD